MKVCIVTSIFHPYARGGAETAAQNAALAFKRAGDDVFVVTAGPWQGWPSLWPSMEEWQGIRIYRFYPLNIFSFLNIAKHSVLVRLIWHVLDMFNLHTYFVVRDILLEEKPDCIMTHNLKGLGYTVHLSMHHPSFLVYHPQWVHTIHDMGLIHPTGLLIYGHEDSFLQNFFLARWYAKVNARLLGSPNWVISPSQFLLDFYKQRGFFSKSKSAVIRNPVEICHHERAEDERGDPVQLKNGIASSSRICGTPRNDNRYCFLYLGQLEPYKGLPLLLKVWRDFQTEAQNTELQIIGDGSMKKEVVKAAKNIKNVRYLGQIAHDRLGEVFNQAHFLIIPSLAYENAPMAISESFSFGVPVIASRLGGIPELIKDDQNGFLFNPGEAGDLLKVLKQATRADWDKLNRAAKDSAEVFVLNNYVKAVKQCL